MFSQFSRKEMSLYNQPRKTPRKLMCRKKFPVGKNIEKLLDQQYPNLTSFCKISGIVTE